MSSKINIYDGALRKRRLASIAYEERTQRKIQTLLQPYIEEYLKARK